MKIYVYTDESGVLDPEHQDLFVIGGLIFNSKIERADYQKRYIDLENQIKTRRNKMGELKAIQIGLNSPDRKAILELLKPVRKFRCIIPLKNRKLGDKILFRRTCYLDTLESCFNSEYTPELNICLDDYAGTDPEAMKKALQDRGWKNVTVKVCDSKEEPLIRAADMISNQLYHSYKVEGEANMIDKERDFKDGIEPDYRQGENNLVRHFNPVYQQMDKSILSFWGVDEKEWEDEMESYLRSHEEKICVLIKYKEIEVDIYKLQKECIDFLVHFVVSTTDRKN